MNEELPEYPGIVELVRCFESAAEAADELERFFGDNPDFADNLQARVAELEEFKASVPWGQIEGLWMFKRDNSELGAPLSLKRWLDANRPQEAQP